MNALIIGLIIGVPLGVFVARVSHRHEHVRGGVLAHVFHVLASAAVCSAPPTALVSVFMGNGIVVTLALAFGLLAISLFLVVIHAVFERPAVIAAAHAEDHGWTAEKARSSGL
jgi:hypothetical protein